MLPKRLGFGIIDMDCGERACLWAAGVWQGGVDTGGKCSGIVDEPCAEGIGNAFACFKGDAGQVAHTIGGHLVVVEVSRRVAP